MTSTQAQRAVVMLGGVGIVASIYADIKNTGKGISGDFSQAVDLVLFTGLAAMVSEGAPDLGLGIEFVLLLNLLFPLNGSPSILYDLFGAKTVTGNLTGKPLPGGAATFGKGSTPGPCIPGNPPPGANPAEYCGDPSNPAPGTTGAQQQAVGGP